jgi:hypothetical protein
MVVILDAAGKEDDDRLLIDSPSGITERLNRLDCAKMLSLDVSGGVDVKPNELERETDFLAKAGKSPPSSIC